MEATSSDWLLTDKVSSWPGTTADRGWRYLRESLERYDTPETDFSYSKAVLETILSHEATSPPQPWLLTSIKVSHSYFYFVLLRLYLYICLKLECEKLTDGLLSCMRNIYLHRNIIRTTLFACASATVTWRKHLNIQYV